MCVYGGASLYSSNIDLGLRSGEDLLVTQFNIQWTADYYKAMPV